MNLNPAQRPAWSRYVIAVFAVALAAAVRAGLLGVLGTRAAFVTFYPAVILAALAGGLSGGLLATALSALTVSLVWIEPVGQFSRQDPADWLALGIFVMSGAVISWAAQAMQDAQLRASEAEAQVKLAMERERAAEELRRYKLLAEHSRDVILYMRGDDGRILEANAAAAKAYGYTRDELQALSIQDLRAADARRLAEGQMAEADTSGILFETIHRRKDGSSFPVEVSSEGASIGGTRTLISVIRDITERKRAEERIVHYNAVLAARNEILRQAMNCETEEELGRSCLAVAEELTQSKFGFIAEINGQGRLEGIAIRNPGWDVSRLPQPGGRSAPAGFAIHGIYGRVLLDGKSFYTNDPASHPDRVGTPEGHPPLTAFLGVPLKQDGKIIGMIAVGNRDGGYRPQDLEALEDVALGVVQALMRKRGEMAVRSSEERLRKAQKAESLGTLAGGVAHDFNNLLVAVVGNASLAQQVLPSDNPAAELLEEILKAGEGLAHLTRQMLAYSGKGQFVVEPLNLSILLPEMSSLARRSFQNKIPLHLELDDDLPLVEADRGQLQQVFMNLVVNAAEAVGSSEGLILVRTGVQEVDELYVRSHPEAAELSYGEYVFLEVRDSGCGMDEATKAKVFDPFFSTKFVGRGLGLAAVAGIARGHNGAIIVGSAPGKGSSFTVLFPASRRAPAVARVPEVSDALPGSGTILVVDDEEVVRIMAKRALERCGYQVLAAESGMAALDILKQHTGEIAAVILDLSMPGMSGEEALPELRRIRPEVRVLISSGYSEAEVMRLFRGQRVSGFIQKPYTLKGIAEKVKACLG